VVQAIEEDKLSLDQANDAHLGLTVLLISQKSILMLALKATTAETQHLKRTF